jgi:hypothetical protein
MSNMLPRTRAQKFFVIFKRRLKSVKKIPGKPIYKVVVEEKPGILHPCGEFEHWLNCSKIRFWRWFLLRTTIHSHCPTADKKKFSTNPKIWLILSLF